MDAKNALAAALDTAELAFRPRELEPNLFGMAMNTEDALREYLRLFVHVPLVGRIGPLARTFDFVADAAPGVKEILGVGKLAYEVRERHYDLVVVDAEASGHIVAQVGAPRVIRELVQVGTGARPDALDARDPRGSRAQRGGGGDHPRGDACQRDHRAVGSPRRRNARGAAGHRRQPRAAGAVRPSPVRGRRTPRRRRGRARRGVRCGRPPGGAGRAAHRGPPATSGAATWNACGRRCRPVSGCSTSRSCSPGRPAGASSRSSPRRSPRNWTSVDGSDEGRAAVSASTPCSRARR